MHKNFAHIGEFLKQCHFKGSDNFFHRVKDSYVILVQMDESPDGTGFTISYGLHPILPGVKKIHHRNYMLTKCTSKGRVLNPANEPVWNYHMSHDDLAALDNKLLAGISALEAELQRKSKS